MQCNTIECIHVTYNRKNNVCFLQHADTKQQILGMQYYSFNYASCAYYSGENWFLAAASQKSMKPGTATSLDSVLEKKSFSLDENLDFLLTTDSKSSFFSSFHPNIEQNLFTWHVESSDLTPGNVAFCGKDVWGTRLLRNLRGIAKELALT
uniref:Uncharacterized protein n=1 Tax=Romanomermis culicivorax TaxID=13658 RepID=A0A915IXJ8_ROMCU